MLAYRCTLSVVPLLPVTRPRQPRKCHTIQAKMYVPSDRYGYLTHSWCPDYSKRSCFSQKCLQLPRQESREESSHRSSNHVYLCGLQVSKATQSKHAESAAQVLCRQLFLLYVQWMLCCVLQGCVVTACRPRSGRDRFI